ncbi:immunoglobulin superfamily member 6 isoform X2 [Bufo bufo]|uniref:immunoglobulin superfamily member 6 isoform X2 n=1 Tax=Bufo bufo TaxID=8384 RepID=UPI001ABE6C38|nr:immunoglobulin superfamily member 6 isoform X2 [Bufo bufo]
MYCYQGSVPFSVKQLTKRQEMDTNCFGGCIFLQLLLLHYHRGVRSCTVEVKQDKFCEALLDQKTANVSCYYKTSNCTGNEKISWFRYLVSTAEELQLKGSRFKVLDNKITLKIENIEIQDSGIYVCGVAFEKYSNPTSKVTGPGTILTVREKPDVVVTPTNTALIVLCVLLFIYFIAVLSFYLFKSKWKIPKFIRKKRGFIVEKDKTHRPRSVFQTIVAEYHKRYDEKIRKQDDSIYQNTQDLHSSTRQECID